MNKFELEEVYKYSSSNRRLLENDNVCGCFYCKKIYNPNEIVEWLNEKEGTAICPYCSVDSVIGESCGKEISNQLLEEMNKEYFEQIYKLGNLRYELDIDNYRLLCSNVEPSILQKIKQTEVIDYNIMKLGYADKEIVSFQLSGSDLFNLEDYFYDKMMEGYPHTNEEIQTEQSKVYEGLMYLIIYLKEKNKVI